MQIPRKRARFYFLEKRDQHEFTLLRHEQFRSDLVNTGKKIILQMCHFPQKTTVVVNLVLQQHYFPRQNNGIATSPLTQQRRFCGFSLPKKHFHIHMHSIFSNRSFSRYNRIRDTQRPEVFKCQNFQKWFPQCFERSFSEFVAALQIFICSDVQGNFRSVEIPKWLFLPRPKVLAICLESYQKLCIT